MQRLVQDAKTQEAADPSGGMDISGSRAPRFDENREIPQSILADESTSKSMRLQYINCLYTNADSLRNKMLELNVRLNSKLVAKEEVHIIAVVDCGGQY